MNLIKLSDSRPVHMIYWCRNVRWGDISLTVVAWTFIWLPHLTFRLWSKGLHRVCYQVACSTHILYKSWNYVVLLASLNRLSETAEKQQCTEQATLGIDWLTHWKEINCTPAIERCESSGCMLIQLNANKSSNLYLVFISLENNSLLPIALP